MPHILVIGGGPAGLRAAEVASAAGARVSLYDQKRSVGRKFLVAGKGGLNLTHSEDIETFATRYTAPGQASQPGDFWSRALERFDNKAIRAWAAKLDVGTFTQKSGRVYPKALKAAPLLRRWVERLRAQGVEFHMSHRLNRLRSGAACFETAQGEEGQVEIEADAIILALGGGSWPQTGSDGAWVETLQRAGVEVTPLSAANCGWEVDWPEEHIDRLEGRAIKNLIASVGEERLAGELMLTRYGMEGGPIYALGPALRSSQPRGRPKGVQALARGRPKGVQALARGQPKGVQAIFLDFKPTFSVDQLVAKMESAKKDFLAESEARWKLTEPMRIILEHFHGPFESAQELAEHAKACRIPLQHPRPLDEAISTAGGVAWKSMDEGSLMLRGLPGVFVAGEMMDWEAPTGGYLLQGCFATGTIAAEGALGFVGIGVSG